MGIGALLQISLLILHIVFVLNEIKIYYAKKELIQLRKDKEKELEEEQQIEEQKKKILEASKKRKEEFLARKQKQLQDSDDEYNQDNQQIQEERKDNKDDEHKWWENQQDQTEPVAFLDPTEDNKEEQTNKNNLSQKQKLVKPKKTFKKRPKFKFAEVTYKGRKFWKKIPLSPKELAIYEAEETKYRQLKLEYEQAKKLERNKIVLLFVMMIDAIRKKFYQIKEDDFEIYAEKYKMLHQDYKEDYPIQKFSLLIDLSRYLILAYIIVFLDKYPLYQISLCCFTNLCLVAYILIYLPLEIYDLITNIFNEITILITFFCAEALALYDSKEKFDNIDDRLSLGWVITYSELIFFGIMILSLTGKILSGLEKFIRKIRQKIKIKMQEKKEKLAEEKRKKNLGYNDQQTIWNQESFEPLDSNQINIGKQPNMFENMTIVNLENQDQLNDSNKVVPETQYLNIQQQEKDEIEQLEEARFMDLNQKKLTENEIIQQNKRKLINLNQGTQMENPSQFANSQNKKTILSIFKNN